MPTPFVPAGTPTRYLPDRPAAVVHILLDVALHFATRSISGRATLTLKARQDQLTAITLHAVDMEIGSVQVAGRTVTVEGYDGRTLRVPVQPAQSRGDSFDVVIEYSAQPSKGLYFLGPDDTNPNRPVQCWTQGQDEDARHVFPCIDFPAEKATTELICTAPRGKLVLSNGDLVERKDVKKDETRWHYKLSSPQASYLVTLVCGDFAETVDRALETGVEVHYLVPVDRAGDAQRTLGKTPAMIDCFSRLIGVPYPHRRYSQVVVSDFLFGGMENTTATTLTDQALLDEEASLDHDVESLVAHELAHQWWGDLVTCREWSEAWLNEGFATYFEYIWFEQDRGRDDADWHGLDQLDGYLHEAGDYQRPIVCRQYRAPIEIFDAHLYEKGGRVLHMLRHLVGDAAFFDALKEYATTYANRNVETRDLARVFEGITGRSLTRFFDQWVGRPGHPDLEVTWTWDEDRNVGQLKVVQTQAPDEVAYELSVRVQFEVEGERLEQPFTMCERSHIMEVRLDKRPSMVVFDQGGILLASVKLDLPVPLLIRQLAAAPAAIDRIAAARALGQKPEAKVVKALALALAQDPFWGVRATAAAQLGELAPRKDALDALVSAQNGQEPKVRRAVAAALGSFKQSAKAADALVQWLQAGDVSVFVLANVAKALGQTRDARAAELLPPLLSRRAFQDVIAARAVEGLGGSTLEAGVEPLIAAYQPNASVQVRRMSLRALAHLAENTPSHRRAREHIELGLLDRDFTVRYAAAMGLSTLNDRKAEPALEAALRREVDGRAWRMMDRTLRRLREGTSDETMDRLKSEMERLRETVQSLRERLERLELSPASPQSAPAPKAPPRPRRPRPAARRTPKPRSKPRR